MKIQCKYFLRLILVIGVSVTFIYGADDIEKRKEELRRKIEKLQQEKANKRQNLDQKMQKIDQGSSENRGEQIARLEGIVKNCQKDTDERCANAVYMLGNLYFDEARDRFLTAQQQFEKILAMWERKKIGPGPISPIPQYNKSIDLYERLVRDYPQFSQRDNALYRLGGIYTQEGKFEESYKAYKEIIDKYPNSLVVANAKLRVGDYLYMHRRPEEAIELLKQIGADVGMQNFELAQFRIASCLYAMSQYEEAINKYFYYIEQCDKKVFTRADFRDEAIQYLSKSFSELSKPIEEARAFFKKNANRKFEIDTYYEIGKDCRENDRNEQAITALEFLLKNYPDYWRAPDAQRMLVESYVVVRNFEKANEAREDLIDRYGAGTKWYKKNEGDPKAMAEAKVVLERTLALIPLFYHERAQKEKSDVFYKKAAKRYKQYIELFPEEKWTVYEFSYYLADCYNEMKNYEEAANCYDYVASAQVNTYGERKERALDDSTKKAAPLAVKQEDAGYNAVLALQAGLDQEKKSKGLSDKDIYSLPITQKLIKYTQKFMERFPDAQAAPDVLFLGANLAYDSERYPDAIYGYRQILQRYPQYKEVEKVLRMVAQCYVFTKEYDKAINMYQDLLAKTKRDDPEYSKLENSIASAMYKQTEQLRDQNKLDLAAIQFLKISEQYPSSKIADISIFDAAVVYEKQNNFSKAGETFILLAKRYSQSKHGLPALSRAADDYLKIKDYNSAAKAYETIYAVYPKEKDLDKVLYNAGLTYEKAKNYPDAIRVYRLIESVFPKSEYASDAIFSVGLAYEQQKDFHNMMNIYKDYVKKYNDDKYKLIQAYLKMAEYYYNNQKYSESAPIYKAIVEIYSKYKKTADIDAELVAKAQYMLGDIMFTDFASVKLIGSSTDIKNGMKKKQNMMKDVMSQYAEAIKLNTEEWTLRSTFQIGMCFVEMAEAVKNQTVHGSSAEKIAAKVQILEMVRQFYQKSEEYFGKNIELGLNQGINNKWIAQSENKLLEMRYRQGSLYEEAGDMLKNAPVPTELSKEDRQMYKEELEEKSFTFREKALPVYESGIRAAVELHIPKSRWLDSLRHNIESINPTAEVLSLRPETKTVMASASGAAGKGTAVGSANPLLNKALKRIEDILQRNISTSEKIAQLRRIERDASEQIERERMKIQELKEQLLAKN